MRRVPDRVLVVGGDGLIGRSVARCFRGQESTVVATTRRREAVSADRPFLDLAEMPAEWSPPGRVDVAIVCAAITGRDQCEGEFSRTHGINVEAPCTLLSRLMQAGTYCVFLSTNLVLGGAQPHLSSDAPYRPCDAYSRQKAEAERQLLDSPTSDGLLAILRITKVLSASQGAVKRWIERGAGGRPFEAFDDVAIAPVAVGHVCRSILAMAAVRSAGVHQLSGWPETSYAGMARALARACGWSEALVRPVEGRKVNRIARATPPHASLDMGDLAALTGMQPPTPDAVAASIREDVRDSLGLAS